MKARDAKTTIDDDFGDAHEYYLVLFPSGQGFRLACRLLRIVGGMLGRSWDALSPMDIGDKLQEVSGILESKIHGESVAKALEMLATQILDEGGEVFVREILQHTHRDGQKVQAYFDPAFAGNYGELFHAVYWTCKENFGPFFKARLGPLFGSLGSLLERVGGTHPILSPSVGTSDSTSGPGSPQ